MKKRSKKLLSLFLSAMMVFSVVPAVAYAEPAAEETTAEQTADQEDNTEAAQDDADADTAEATAKETDKDSSKTETATNNDVAIQAENNENKVTVSGITIQTPTVEFKGANAAVAEALTKNVKIDETDPAIKGLRKELESLEIVGGEAGIEDNVSMIATYDAEETKNALSEDQINTVVAMYQQYLNQWSANANVLGVQNPFFRTFNDKKDDLGILGEMLALAGKSVDDVRTGKYSYDDLTGMIINFTYGDKLGIQYYGKDVTDARDEVLDAVEKSGAKTDAQKLLVINDWLAHKNTFDMGYIMNSDKEEDEKPMIAETPTKQEHYDDVYNVIYQVYEPQIKANFHDQIFAGIEDNLRQQFYENAIQNAVYQQVLGKDESEATDEEKSAAQDQAKAYVEKNKDAIDEDPDGFARENFGDDAADQLKEQADAFIKNAEENGVEVQEGVTMTVEQLTQNSMANDKIVDLDGDGTNDTTANDAIPVYAKQAASGMTDGVINYWEGSQFGALGMGTSVCLGYSKAYSYFVQCLNKDVYLKTPSKGFDSKTTVTQDDGTTAQVCDNWKSAEDLYYDKDGNIDIDAGYTVDLVRISFQSEVTMFGHTEDNFASDHYWNAVKVNGKWYYVDPCYTDVYTEVMSRDRVETDGDMSHAFFLFSHDSTESLYSGNYSEIKTLYKSAATDKSYETAWMSRAASNVYTDGTYAYYLYDSTDLFSRASSMSSQSSTEYKLVRHKLTDTDGTDGDNDYETLINFTDKENEDDDDTFVSVLNKDGKLEKNAALTKLYAQFLDEQSIYPSIGLTAALYNGKIYFNVSNDIMSYDLTSGEVATVKEYNTVSATRDKTNVFGGMAFTTVADEKNADFTVKNHPITGLTIKEDGTMVVSIATNFAFISGKSSMTDHSSYGYEYEETDYNPNYTNYKKYASIMGNQPNDNDEFMWSANFVDKVSMKTLTGDSHSYEKVSVPATCGRNAFTEERCSDCGLIKADTRKEQKDTAHEHHYIKFHEVYYTTSDDGKTNEADNYVCPECGACITEPVKSQYEQANTNYEKRKKIWDAAQENAKEGHNYTVTDGTWSDDNSSVTFQNLRCESCYEQKDKLDCLLSSDTNETNKANYDSIDKALSEKVTAKAELVSHTGTCDKGVTANYKATGKTDDGIRYTATTSKTTEAGKHQYTGKFNWKEKEDADGKGTGEYTATVSDVKCSVCGDEPKDDQITVTVAKDEKASVAATCEAAGKDVWTATVSVKDGDNEVGTLEDTKEVELKALGHKYSEPEFTWTKGDNNTYTVKAKRTCKNDASHVEEVDAKVTEKTDGASCTEAGKITYTATATFDGKDYTDTKTENVDALGHNYGEPEWKWSKNEEDGTWTDVAVFTCTRCKDEQQEVGKVTSERTEPTCEEKGKVVYTAKATFEGKEYTGTKTVELKAKGHSYGDPTFNWTKGDNNTYTATATFTCKNDASHVETVDAKVTEKTDGASCTEAGKITYTAKATFEDKEYTDKKEEEVAALGHNYDIAEKNGWKWTADKEKGYVVKATFECTRCKDSHVVDATVEKSEVNGETVYTATATYEGVTRTDTKSLNMSVSYVTHVQDIGWEADKDNASAWKKDGAIAGTTGKAKQLEAIKIKLPDGVSGSVEYYSHVQDKGWEKAWSHKDGEESGTTGSFKKLEAIKIRLSGNVADNYDIYYRVHAENFGWLGWAKNGESAGTAGYNYRLEAIQIVLVKKGETANLPSDPKSNYEDSMVSRLVKYQAHVRDLGDQAVVYDGATCGTVGKAKPVEALRISLPSLPDGTIKYDAHVENIGWQNKWAKNGEMIGTKGRALQIEAIKIDLDGSVKDEYDIYYRVHSANVGWLGWAKNGEKAGTAGFAYGVEAVQIKLVKKGTTPNLPASANAKAYIKK